MYITHGTQWDKLKKFEDKISKKLWKQKEEEENTTK
jgi:hypothetical protein